MQVIVDWEYIKLLLFCGLQGGRINGLRQIIRLLKILRENYSHFYNKTCYIQMRPYLLAIFRVLYFWRLFLI